MRGMISTPPTTGRSFLSTSIGPAAAKGSWPFAEILVSRSYRRCIRREISTMNVKPSSRFILPFSFHCLSAVPQDSGISSRPNVRACCGRRHPCNSSPVLSANAASAPKSIMSLGMARRSATHQSHWLQRRLSPAMAFTSSTACCISRRSVGRRVQRCMAKTWELGWSALKAAIIGSPVSGERAG